MGLFTILLGLIGLGVVVFVHELGHFGAAKITGVEVEEFSLGWGPRLLSRQFGKTRYSISVLPIGGYCRMKGENAFREAIETGQEHIPKEPGSYYGATPGKRSFIAISGPLMNIIFAFLAYFFIMSIGYDIKSWDTKILLASDFDANTYPADEAGLKSGDRILKLNYKKVDNFFEIQEIISMSANKELDAELLRNGQLLTMKLEPSLDKESGAGRIGIYPWVEPVIENVNKNGPAALAGLKPGDRIVAVDNMPVQNTLAMASYLETKKPGRIEIRFIRDAVEKKAALVLAYQDEQSDFLGINWKSNTKTIKASGAMNSLGLALAETGKTIASTYKGLGSLFLGVNVLKAVSGPARITWMVGSIAKESIASRQPGAFSSFLGFLAILSIGLCVMNLLPIPLLDGGALLFFIIEWIRRKPAKIKTMLRYQTIGLVVIGLIFLLALTGDVLFFSGR